MSEVFSREFHVRWSDLDPNLHMRHTAYGDVCAATRFQFLESLGFDMQAFAQLKIGPIIFNENINYLAEVLPGDKVVVDLRMAGMSEDRRKWKMAHRVFRKSDQKLAATLDITGAWFSLQDRKVVSAPDVLHDKISSMPKTEDFETL